MYWVLDLEHNEKCGCKNRTSKLCIKKASALGKQLALFLDALYTLELLDDSDPINQEYEAIVVSDAYQRYTGSIL